jgi:hypothetical protein
MRPIALSLLFCSLATALPATAQIYRWVDDLGVVNYANRPPAQASRAVRIDTQESRVSVMPTAPRVARAGVAPPPSVLAAPADFPSRIDRATVANLQGALEWRERCFAERRVDCTSPTAATYDFGSSYSPNSSR